MFNLLEMAKILTAPYLYSQHFRGSFHCLAYPSIGLMGTVNIRIVLTFQVFVLRKGNTKLKDTLIFLMYFTGPLIETITCTFPSRTESQVLSYDQEKENMMFCFV